MANFKEEILLLKIVADVSKSAKDIAGLADVLEKPVSSIADLEEHTKTLTKALKELPQEGTKGFQELSQAIGAVKFIDTDEAGKELIALFDTLNKQLGDNKAKLKQFNDELGRPGTADANIRLLADSFSDIKSVLDKTPQSVKEVEDRLKVLQTFLKRIPAEGTEAFEQLSFEIANLSTGDGDLDNAGAEITQFRETLTTELIASNEALKQFRASMKAPIELPEGSLNALRQELITLRKEFDNLSATERDGEFGQQLVARINNVDKEVRELEESTGRAQRNVGAYGLAIKQALDEYRTIPEIQADLKSLGAEQQRLTTVGNKIAQSLRAGGIEAEKMANILRAQGKTGKDTQDILQKELLETNKILQQVSNTAAQSNRQLTSLQNDVRSATASAGRFVKGALLAVGADLSFQAIKSAVTDTIKTFEEFEERVGTLAGILGKPIERIRELRQNAEALGAATKFSASQVAELQTEFARIGFNEQQILDATESTLALAQATGETLAESAAVAGATLQGFGLDASEAGRVTDVMAKSFNNTALSLESFRNSMKVIAPVARAANVSLEESTAILGALSNAGIKGEMAGTALRNVFADFGREKGGLTDFLGTSVNSFDELVDALDKAKDRSNNFALANKFLGEQVRPSVLSLLNNVDALRQLKDAYDNAAGAAARTAEIQTKTLNFAIEEFSGSIEGLQIAIGSRLAPAYKDLLTFGSAWADTLQRMFAIPISEQLATEQVQLNGLVQSLFSAEEGTERYAVLLEELNTLYPEVISKIDQEEAKLQTLLTQLTQVSSSDQERVDALTALKNIYPDVLSQITDENANLAALIPQITDANIGNEEKKKLIEQLKVEYPDFLAFINENTSFESQLREALNQTNREYVNRIILQQQREKVENQLNKVASRQNEVFGLERRIEENLAKTKQQLIALNEKYATTLDAETGTLEERIKRVVEAAKAEGQLGGVYSKVGQQLSVVSRLSDQLWYSKEQLNKSTEKGNDLQSNYEDVLKRLGGTTGDTKDQIELLRIKIDELEKQKASIQDPLKIGIFDTEIKKLQQQLIELTGPVVKTAEETGDKISTAITDGVKKGAEKAIPGTIRYMREALGKLRTEIDNTPDLNKRIELVEKASEIEKKLNEAESLLKAFEARNQDKAIQIKLSEKDKLLEQIKALNSELDKATRDRRVKIEGQIDDVIDKLFDLQREIEDTFGDSGSLEIKPKFEEYKTIKAQLDDLQDRALLLETPREIELKADIEKTKASIDDLNERAATFSSLSEFTVTPDFQRLSTLEKSLERMNTELKNVQEQSVIEVELQTEQAKARLTEISGELLKLTGKDITPKLKEVERLNAQLTELKAKLDSDVPEERELTIRASIGAAEQLISKLDGEIDRLRNKEVRLPVLTDELIAASKEVDVLTAKLKTASSEETNRINLDITQAQAKVEKLQDEIIRLADEDVTVDVDIVGLSESDVAKLFDTLIKGKNGIEAAIEIGAKSALEQQLKGIDESERATLQSLANLNDATSEGFAQRAVLEAQLTDIQREQEQIRLRFAVASTQEGTEERKKAVLDLVNFEIAQGLAAAKANRAAGQQLDEQLFLERKNQVLKELSEIEGTDAASKARRAELEKELTRITIIEEIARKTAAIEVIDEQIRAQQTLLTNTEIGSVTRAEAEAKIAELQTERLKNQAEVLNAEVSLTKDSVDKQLEEYQRLEEEKKELRDAGFQVIEALVDAFLTVEKNKVEESLKSQQAAIDKRYADETRLAGNNAELKAKIDAKYQNLREKAEKDAAKKRKDIALKEALIGIALAVIKALPNPIAATLAAVLGGIQLALIQSQEFEQGGPLDMVFRTATKGSIPDKGTITGKRHSQGGVKAMYGGKMIEVEGGEGTTRNGQRRWIFNRGVWQDNVLRGFALQTHRNSYHPMADKIAGYINHLGLMKTKNLKFEYGGSFSPSSIGYNIIPPRNYFAEGGILDPVASGSLTITNSILTAVLSVLTDIRTDTDEVADTNSRLLRLQAQQASNADRIDRKKAV